VEAVGASFLRLPLAGPAGGLRLAWTRAPNLPTCRSSFGGRRVGEVRRGPLRSARRPGPRQPWYWSRWRHHRRNAVSHTGVRGCWPSIWGPATARWHGCGASTQSRPGAPRRSNSRLIPNGSPRSPTSSGFTWIPRERDRASGSQDTNFRACLP